MGMAIRTIYDVVTAYFEDAPDIDPEKNAAFQTKCLREAAMHVAQGFTEARKLTFQHFIATPHRIPIQEGMSYHDIVFWLCAKDLLRSETLGLYEFAQLKRTLTRQFPASVATWEAATSYLDLYQRCSKDQLYYVL